MNRISADPGAAQRPHLAKPTASYKRHALLAMTGLIIFMLAYLALATWFLFTAYRLTFGAGSGEGAFLGYFIGACAAFLAIFMLKAVFFVKRGNTGDTVEITPSQQPRLFVFLHDLADKAGAPRPHKVFLSARVNASVFYDLSIVNFLFPSKKNLEIGLGLVNALNQGEFKAVLAHEFGHFAQRAMAVGRWVYIAQQITEHLIARRDKLDDFLRGLSNFDFRIAWIGWILSLIVWSIRSLLESAFHVVVLMQRALSREMEMQADLVSVSLTGSDALIHALHRLQAADDSWNRAAGIAFDEKARNKLPPDLFSLQSRVMEHMGRILNDPTYHHVPPIPFARPHEHRIFKADLAQPPQMWLTHPLNHEREENAKKHYIAAAIDESSAWDLFDDPAALRAQVTAKFLDATEATPVSLEESLQSLEKQFDCEYLKSRYRGVYLGRSAVRWAEKTAALYGSTNAVGLQHLQRLYPNSLTMEMEKLRTLEKELAQLKALQAGTLKATNGIMRYQGKELHPKQLPQAIAEAERELQIVEQHLQAHDMQCRTAHLFAAEKAGEGWVAYLKGLLAIIHYAGHTQANLRDAQRLLGETVNVVTATRKVNAAGVERVLDAAGQLYRLLDKTFSQKNEVILDSALAEKLQTASWSEALGDFTLPPPNRENINEWIKAIDSWVNQAAGASSALHNHALERLLGCESMLAEHALHGTTAETAPTPPQVPERYDTLIPGKERKCLVELGWWEQFQTANGKVAALARFVVAGGIVGTVLGLGGNVGTATLTVYNGLARTVVVKIGGEKMQIPAFSSRTQQLAPDRGYQITASTVQGEEIEAFEERINGSFANYVYNIASASPMVEWTAVYGYTQNIPDRPLGTPRWFTTSAAILFADPPRSVSTKGGGTTRLVLSGMGDAWPSQQLSMLSGETDQQRMITTHARWDDANSRAAMHWLHFAQSVPGFDKLIAARLRENPDSPVLLRVEQDSAAAEKRAEVCARHQARSTATPQNPALRYAAIRCIASHADKEKAFQDAYKKWPNNGWFSFATGHYEAEHGHWQEAVRRLEQARSSIPPLIDPTALDLARIHRLTKGNDPGKLALLAQDSIQLSLQLALETGDKIESNHHKAYLELGRGNLAKALELARSTPEGEMRLIRLAAASDGAASGMIEKALALPLDKGMDDSTLWTGAALAKRMNRDITPYMAPGKKFSEEHADTMFALLDAIHKGADAQTIERQLDGLPPELRGQVYSMGIVIRGKNAPASWRAAANRLLFVSERPYFSGV